MDRITLFLPRAILTAVAALAALMVSTPGYADDFSLSLADESVKGQFRASDAFDDASLGAGYTFREGGTHLLNLDGHVTGRTAIENLPVSVGLGGRKSFLHDSPINGGSLAPGGYFSANIPEVPGLSVNGELYLAPSILSYGDVDGARFLEASVSYRIIRKAEVMAGFRYVSAELDEGRSDFRVEEDLIIGMRLLF